MSSPAIPITGFQFTNRTDSEQALILEPEGDVIWIPAGQSCQITTDGPIHGERNCEVEFGAAGELTLYLAVVKQVCIGGKRIR